jgi:hypothetical protein
MKMQRLTTATLSSFLNAHSTAAILIGAPDGEATMDAAASFAEAWVDHRDHAAFGYVDAFEQPAAARWLDVRVLPTTLVFQDGIVVGRIEGRCSSHMVAAAVTSAHVVATAPRANADGFRQAVHA